MSEAMRRSVAAQLGGFHARALKAKASEAQERSSPEEQGGEEQLDATKQHELNKQKQQELIKRISQLQTLVETYSDSLEFSAQKEES